MMPLISLIVPIFNGEKYIATFLDQCIKQEYTNLELIIVNDGSTDRTIEILQEYAKTIPGLKIYTQENCGPSAARNVGMKYASGEYVAFADVDDYIYPFYISQMYRAINEQSADIAFCNYMKVMQIDDITISKNEISSDNIIVFDKIQAIDDFNYRRHLTGYSCLKLIKKELLDGVEFPENIVYGEDFIFTYNLLKKSKKVVYSERIGYLYWQNNNSATHIKRDNTKKYKDAWKVHMDYLDDVRGTFPSLINGAVAKCYVLAVNNTTRIFDAKRDKEFLDELNLFIKAHSRQVMRDKESKLIVRIIGLFGFISARVLCNMCKLVFLLMEKNQITFKRTV